MMGAAEQDADNALLQLEEFVTETEQLVRLLSNYPLVIIWDILQSMVNSSAVWPRMVTFSEVGPLVEF